MVVGAVIFRQGKILLLQRSSAERTFPNMWELPSGRREVSEKTEDALMREVREETGLDISVILPFSVFDYQIERPEEIRDTVQINFLTEVRRNPTVSISKEHQNFAWVDKKDAASYHVSSETRRVLERAFQLRPLLTTKK